MKTHKTVEEYIEKNDQWSDELALLRQILIKSGMEEGIKWGAPIYMVDGKNVVGIGAFKSYVGLWFHQGVFLKDEHNVLENAQEGKTKALRQWRFNSLHEMDQKLIAAYVNEAIENQKQGRELKPAKPSKKVDIPSELAEALKADKELKKAFDHFSPSHQQEYANHIAEAKREDTRQRRLEKIIPMIKGSVGLHDKYKK